MESNRLQDRFRENAANRCAGLLPYFTSGFPNITATSEFIQEADRAGATAIEIGIPYSDSIADGPVIQDSFHHALENGHRLDDAFRVVADVRPAVGCAIIAMVSYSVVHRTGVDRFMRSAADAGFDGVIVPDVPVEEARPIAELAVKANLDNIGLVAPTTTPARRSAIIRATTGFLYKIAVAGTTGERSSIQSELVEQVGELKNECELPVCVGFGISTVEHVRAVCRVADGAIVGSALIRRIAEATRAGLSLDATVSRVGEFLREMMHGVA